MEKISNTTHGREKTIDEASFMQEYTNIPPKVSEVYTSVGKLLHSYKSGKRLFFKALSLLGFQANFPKL
jgi:hypothetical protein